MRLLSGLARSLACGATVLGVTLGVTIGLAFSASAASVDITFTGTTGAGTTGSNVIGAAPGDTLTAVVSVTAGAGGISSYGISVLFDTDFMNELDLILASELLSAPFVFNATAGCASTQESTAALTGEVFTCEAGTFGDGALGSETVDILELTFLVTGNVSTDGFDISTGLFHVGFDGMFDNSGGSVSPVFGLAAVQAIPEPNTALLVGFGLVCLSLRSRDPLA